MPHTTKRLVRNKESGIRNLERKTCFVKLYRIATYPQSKVISTLVSIHSMAIKSFIISGVKNILFSILTI